MSDMKTERPLSPHLSIYKPILTMVMSVLHRATGVALYGGTLFFAWWLIAAASGPDYFNFVQGFFDSFIGRLILLGFTWALLHHMLGGIRHLIWDTGHGLGPGVRDWFARMTLIGSLSLTALVWIIGYAVRSVLLF